MKTDGSLLIINQNIIHKCEQGLRLKNPVLKCLPINNQKLPLFRSVAPACDLIIVNSQQLELYLITSIQMGMLQREM